MAVLVVLTGGWIKTLFQGFSGRGLSFLLPKKLCRFFLRGPVNGMVFIVYPFMKGMIEGL